MSYWRMLSAQPKKKIYKILFSNSLIVIWNMMYIINIFFQILELKHFCTSTVYFSVQITFFFFKIVKNNIFNNKCKFIKNFSLKASTKGIMLWTQKYATDAFFFLSLCIWWNIVYNRKFSQSQSIPPKIDL